MADFMIRIIEHDFNVKILSKNEGSVLYYGFKESFVHFVLYEQHTIYQAHIPRLKCAIGFEYLMEKSEASPCDYQASNSILFTEAGENQFQITFGKNTFELSPQDQPDFFAAVNADIKAYKQAYEVIDKGSFNKSITKIDSYTKKPVLLKPENLHLLLVFLFEQLISENEKSTGSFSFPELCNNLWENKLTLSGPAFRKMAESLGQYSLGPDSDLFQIIQYNVFGEFFWSNDSAKSVDEVSKILKDGYKKLTQTQKAAFKALHKGHKVPVLLIFGFVTGEISFTDYLKYTTHSLQPDSREEQKIRMDATMVDYFFRFAKERDYQYLGYNVYLPEVKGSKERSIYYFDPHFLTARDKAIRVAKDFKEKHNYKGVKLALWMAMRIKDNDYAYPNVEVLNGERMSSEKILKSLDYEAGFLKNNFELEFPIMGTNVKDEQAMEDTTYIAVNQFHSTLYYFTV